MSKDELEKEPQIAIRDMEEEDWRGLIAIIGWVGVFVLSGVCILRSDMNALAQVVGFFGAPIGLITGYYFKDRAGKQ